MIQDHPGKNAEPLFMTYTTQRLREKALRDMAASKRREAKAAKLKVDAELMRKEAKTISAEAQELKQAAASTKKELLSVCESSAALLTHRMPPEFAAWGIGKTRGYVKLLNVLIAQIKRTHPNLMLASRSIGLLLSHNAWEDQIVAALAALPATPKTLP